MLGLLSDDITWDEYKVTFLGTLDQTDRINEFANTKQGIEVWTEEYLKAAGGRATWGYLK